MNVLIAASVVSVVSGFQAQPGGLPMPTAEQRERYREHTPSERELTALIATLSTQPRWAATEISAYLFAEATRREQRRRDRNPGAHYGGISPDRWYPECLEEWQWGIVELQIEKVLARGNADDCRAVLRHVGQYCPYLPAFYDELIELSTHEDGVMRASALQWLGTRRWIEAVTTDPEATDRLVDMLVVTLDRDASVPETLAALQCLMYLGPMAVPAIPQIIEATRAEGLSEWDNRYVVMSAHSALYEIGPPVVPGLMERIRETDGIEQLGFIRLVASIERPPPETAAFLLNALHSDNPKVVMKAAHTAWLFDRDAALLIPRLRTLTEHENPDIAHGAIISLGEFGPLAPDASTWLATIEREWSDDYARGVIPGTIDRHRELCELGMTGRDELDEMQRR